MEKIKFFSRKNQVYLVVDKEKSYVEKIFADKSKYENEFKYHRLLTEKGITVPKVWGYVDKISINYEYIEGKLLSLELLEGNSRSFINMGQSLKNFHKTFKNGERTLLAGDVNLRNFIAKGNKIFFLDYEEYREGDGNEDVSTFLSHLISHREVEDIIRLEMGKTFLNAYYKDEQYPPNLENDIILKAKRLAMWRGFGELETEIIELIKGLG